MTRPLSDHKLYLQVDGVTYRRLKAYALATGKPMTVVGAACLTAYLQQRADLGEQIPEIGQPEPAPVLHDLLDGLEQRIVATMDTQSKQMVGVVSSLKVIEVMIEKAVLQYLQHTPAVSEGLKGQAAASGQARFDLWQAAVKKAAK